MSDELGNNITDEDANDGMPTPDDEYANAVEDPEENYNDYPVESDEEAGVADLLVEPDGET